MPETPTMLESLAATGYENYWRDGGYKWSRLQRESSEEVAWFSVTRAVLSQLREPDEGMIAAGIDDRSRGEGSIQSIFRAMIDHILAEKGEG